jgi:PKD repeat protein
MRAGRDGGRRRPVWRWPTALAVIVAALVVGGPAAAHPRVHPSGHALGVVPRGHAAQSPSLLALTSPLDYHGGPVLHGMTVRTIFWEPSNGTKPFPAGYETLVNRFYADVAHDSGQTTNPYSSVVQYPDGVGPAAYRSTFAGSFHVTDPLPLSDCSDPVHVGANPPPCIMDQDLTAEIAKVMADHGLAPRDGDYFALYLAPDIVDCADDGTGVLACSTDVYCAYHSSFTEGNNPTNVLYANEPYPLAPSVDPPSAGCDTKASPNSNPPADDIIDTSSHEQNETVTDPLGTGWWVDDGGPDEGMENGDKCNFQWTPDDGPPNPAGNVTINGNPYLIQLEWSNDGLACVTSYTDPIAGTFTMRPTGGVEAGQAAEFDGSGADSAGVIGIFRWSFGDGSPTTTSSLSFTSHVFAAPGTYDVTLTAADNTRAGGSDQLITVRPGPVAVITAPSTVPSGTSTVFDASSSKPGDYPIFGADWSFGDGKTGTGYPVPHTFARPGTYRVTLTVSDAVEVKASTTQLITVTNRAPTAVVRVSPSRPVPGQTVTFDGRGSFDPDGTVQSYVWSFGDGSSATGAMVRHVFHGTGARTATLTVRDDSAASGSAHLTVHVARAPCIVPGLRGLSLRQARTRLTASHCTLGHVGHAHSARVAAGHVLSSSPGRAAHRAHGARVSVTISTGP